MDEWKWPHFKPEELACNCCQTLPDDCVDEALLGRLEVLRAYMGQSLVVNSGHRCRVNNYLVKGAAYSQHKKLAVDLSLRSLDPVKLYTAARELGFLGIGLGETFLHLDMRNDIDGHHVSKRLAIWNYGKLKKPPTWFKQQELTT